MTRARHNSSRPLFAPSESGNQVHMSSLERSPLRSVPQRSKRDPGLVSGGLFEGAFGCEREFARLTLDSDLEETLRSDPSIAERIGLGVGKAVTLAYGGATGHSGAHRFLQRVLYRVNRLMLFWDDDLSRYENDRSPFLNTIRAHIESAWQSWELRDHCQEELLETDASDALRSRVGSDLSQPPSAAGLYFQDRATLRAYQHMVAIGSLDGLVEASQLSRTLGGVGNPVHSVLTRLLLEEYGGGRIERKHSTYFRTMMESLGIDATPEIHFDAVPWEVLATINHSFLLSDRRRLFLRYVGGLLHTEMTIPNAFRCYVTAAQRLGLPTESMSYWELHIKEDLRHGPWMLNEVAIPLAQRYPAQAWELVLGYDQQKRMSARAGQATVRACLFV